MSVVPTVNATSAAPPALSPVLLIPTSPRPSSESHCRSVIASEIGMRSSPIPRKTRAWRTYIEPEPERIWPQLRRLPRRSGATGVQVARTVTKATSATTAASMSTTKAGFCRKRMSPREPLSTAVQKRSVAPVPKSPAVGTA